MPLRQTVAFAAATFAVATLAGCGQEPGVVDLSAAETYQRLVGSTLPDLVFNRQCGILIHVRPSGTPERKVVWRVSSSGRNMVDFTAKLTPVSEKKTKVELTLSSGPKGGEAYDGNQFYQRPAFNQPLRPAVEEQIAALLEDRAYNPKHVPRGTDKLCDVQRAGLEAGHRFRVDDRPGMDARQSAACAGRRSGSC